MSTISRSTALLLFVVAAAVALLSTGASAAQRLSDANAALLLSRLSTPNVNKELFNLRSASDTIDVVIQLNKEVDAMRLKADVEKRVFASMGPISKAATSDFVARELVHELRMTAELTQRDMLTFLQEKQREHQGITMRSLWIVNAIAVNNIPVTLLRDFVAHFPADIKQIELNARFTTPVLEDNDDEEESVEEDRFETMADKVEDNIKYVQAPEMWALGFEGEGITISMVDTGVDAVAHPALKDAYRGKDGNHNYNWWDPYKNSKEPRDTDRHGTHCTGSMVGDDRTKSTRHVYGVAPKANYIACLGLNGGSGTLEALLSCWQFTLAPTDLEGNNPNPERRAHITSNSWGANGYNSAFDVFKTAADSLRAAGIFVVLAAGNSGSRCGSMGSPGVFENVFAVCSVHKKKGTISSFSSRGPVPAVLGTYNKPDLCAPGQSIVSTVPGGRYSSLSGTSMATPHVAAAAALLWEAVPEMSRDVEMTEEVLKLSAMKKPSKKCKTPQEVPNYEYGFGNMQILDAYNMAKSMLKK